jgi:alpha-N-arabinofuranosidase
MDHVKAKLRSNKKLRLSFDEWNVWYMRRPKEKSTEDWPRAPRLLEDEYNVADAVAVGSYLISLLSHADRVAVACQAQLVNVIAPIRAEPGGPAWRQTTFHPFAQTARFARGDALRVEPVAPTLETKAYGAVPALHATATYQEEDGQLSLFAVNRDRREPLRLSADLRAFGPLRVAHHLEISGEDHTVTNTQADPDRVVPRTVTGTAVADGRLDVTLPPLSWSVINLTAVTP